MPIEDITLALFAACNGLRVLAYLPQLWKAAMDANGASAISRITWLLFLLANSSTVGYALVNRHDPWLAICFGGNALCCAAILGVACWKGYRYAARMRATAAAARPTRWTGRGSASAGLGARKLGDIGERSPNCADSTSNQRVPSLAVLPA